MGRQNPAPLIGLAEQDLWVERADSTVIFLSTLMYTEQRLMNKIRLDRAWTKFSLDFCNAHFRESVCLNIISWPLEHKLNGAERANNGQYLRNLFSNGRRRTDFMCTCPHTGSQVMRVAHEVFSFGVLLSLSP